MKVLDCDTGNLLRAVVQPHSDARGMTTAKLASKISCWENVIDSARQHGISPKLYYELVANVNDIPQEALELARVEFERNAFHCFANTAELLDVLKAFESSGIPAMPFKGVVLGASAYGDMTSRTAGDLDILIYYSDLLRATRILQDRGYTLTTKVLEDGSPEARNYFEYHFEREDDGMVIELRWRLELTQSRYKHNIGMDWVWPRRRFTRLAGADVPNFEAVSEILMLCMHGSKHVWSRLVWICDVAKLVESEPLLDWDSVVREAKRLGLWRCLALGVLLARSLTGVQVPAEVLRKFEKDKTARNLANFLQQHVVSEPGKVPIGRIPYEIQILDFRERAGVILSPAFIRPNARDRAVVKLPKSLEPLYYVIRPFRLLRDRTAR